jgi:hypothetical protein
MKIPHATRRIGIVTITAGLALLLALPAEIHSATPTIKLPGPYPYETPVQVAAPPPVSDSSPPPTPAPYPYAETSPPVPAVQGHESRAAAFHRPLTAKAVREAAFKFNGVSNFCGFLASLPADVSVFDPKLGTTRTLVKGGRVVRRNVAWLRKHKQAATHEQNGTQGN